METSRRIVRYGAKIKAVQDRVARQEHAEEEEPELGQGGVAHALSSACGWSGASGGTSATPQKTPAHTFVIE